MREVDMTPEERKIYRKAYYQRNKVRMNAASAKYREAHRHEPAFKEAQRRDSKKWWTKYGRDCTYRMRHGVTLAEVEARIERQNNRCPIGDHIFGTGKTWNSPVLDHDHKTGQHRDILCRTHNTALGGFHDSIEELEAAIRYLTKHKQGDPPCPNS